MPYEYCETPHYRNIMKEKRGDAFVTKKNLFILV